MILSHGFIIVFVSLGNYNPTKFSIVLISEKNACVSTRRYQIMYATSGKWKGWAYPLHESLENTVCQLFTQLTQRSLRGMQNSGDEFSHFNFNSNSSST